MRSIALLLALSAVPLAPAAQTSKNPDIPDPAHRDWHGEWVTHPTTPLRQPLMLHFKRALDVPSAPASYIVRVSADNRFILYVNGTRVGDGPARGDLTHKRNKHKNLAPLL